MSRCQCAVNRLRTNGCCLANGGTRLPQSDGESLCAHSMKSERSEMVWARLDCSASRMMKMTALAGPTGSVVSGGICPIRSRMEYRLRNSLLKTTVSDNFNYGTYRTPTGPQTAGMNQECTIPGEKVL